MLLFRSIFFISTVFGSFCFLSFHFSKQFIYFDAFGFFCLDGFSMANIFHCGENKTQNLFKISFYVVLLRKYLNELITNWNHSKSTYLMGYSALYSSPNAVESHQCAVNRPSNPHTLQVLRSMLAVHRIKILSADVYDPIVRAAIRQTTYLLAVVFF